MKHKMKHKMGKVLIFLGLLFILIAVSMLVQKHFIEKEANSIIKKNGEKLKEQLDGENVSGSEVILIDNMAYMGILRFEKSNMEILVLSKYKFEDLDISPCVFSGSYKDDTLVIAGHNYKRHFRCLTELEENDKVDLITCDGTIHEYYVINTELINPTDSVSAKELVEKEEDDEWDMTLFTCNYNGNLRFVVRCKKI